MHFISDPMIDGFIQWLILNEKSTSTVSKYAHDVRTFACFVSEKGLPVSKETVMAFKDSLRTRYKVSSANSMLAAVNHFLRYCGWEECVVHAFKTQRDPFRENSRELTKAEYLRLVNAACKKGRERLMLIMQTICSTGIRVSELRFITVEAAEAGSARITLKGKSRTVLLPVKLCRKLRKYASGRGITSGTVFVTRGGRPVDRSNILHEMKSLCGEAHVERTKIFPHNLRHLFAVTYYRLEKDLAHLADILGHSNINTTRIYTACSSTEQQRVMSRLGLVT